MRAPLSALVFLMPLVIPAIASAAPATAPSGLPLETITIQTKAGPHAFTVEVAADEESREKGLMYRTAMAPDAGMLFDFHTPQLVSFWMENTVLPLDMLFVRADGTVARIKANATPYSRANIPSGEPVQLVIELNGGRAAELGITEGAKVQAPNLKSKAR
jgi:uncharacterized membrane protein (UPF0127 family)